jgi:methyl-accepting chemotaxis protein
VAIVLATAIGAIAVFALRNVVASKDRVIDVNSRLLADTRLLQMMAERKVGEYRGFLLTRSEAHLAGTRAARTQFLELAEQIRQSSSTGARRQLELVIHAEDDHQRAVEENIAMRRTDAPLDAVARFFDERSVPLRTQMDASLTALASAQEALLHEATQASSATAALAMMILVVMTLTLVLAAIVTALVLTRMLGRQVGTAVGQVQSSSSELQAASTQQATSAREQSTAMSEISTTISELLATSRQITESAQRVAQIAAETARSAGAGDDTVAQAQESIVVIRRQMDLIVTHMLELGRKSQHIGAVLGIVSELAEQTNILAINATIEAAGAGEAGRRFAIVADEIRKLADRVGGSTKEIRGLIEDIRSAVNTTVMSTETGSKTVEAGSRQFDQVAVAFKQIARLVTTTTEAAREIELSTKQQMTAVEQVNVAIADIAQASRETEASSSQTLQTASQLAVLSRDLLRLVKSQRAAA